MDGQHDVPFHCVMAVGDVLVRQIQVAMAKAVGALCRVVVEEESGSLDDDGELMGEREIGEFIPVHGVQPEHRRNVSKGFRHEGEGRRALHEWAQENLRPRECVKYHLDAPHSS